jgi:hypothetical protein
MAEKYREEHLPRVTIKTNWSTTRKVNKTVDIAFPKYLDWYRRCTIGEIMIKTIEKINAE